MADESFISETEGEGSTASALEALVGEGKKFANVEALALSKLEADAFIERIKAENAQLREAQGKKEEAATVTELMEALKQSKEANKGETTSPEDLQETVKTILRRELDEHTREANREQGKALVLQKAQGDVKAANAYVAERAQELGLSVKVLTDLSASSPKAFAELMDIKPNVTSKGAGALPKVNTESLNVNNRVLEIDGHKTKAYYDLQKKEMGALKYLQNSKLQNQLLKDAIALKEKFNQ